MADSLDSGAIEDLLPPRSDGGKARIRELDRLIGGATSEIWSFVTDEGDELVLRQSVRTMSRGASITSQAAAMRSAAAGRVPVPHVYASGDRHPQLGAFMIMSRVHGETIPRRIQRNDSLGLAKDQFAIQSGAALAAISRINVAQVPGLETEDPLERVSERLESQGLPSATFEWALRYLDANRPDVVTKSIVHGDFRLGNLVIGAEGLRAVLDWELVHLGDPREDLGWLCTKTWRFGGLGPVGGFGSREDLLTAYEQSGGQSMTPGDLHWWELYGSLRWGVMCMEQVRRSFVGTPSVELAAIGRRTAEVEWDLLGMLP